VMDTTTLERTARVASGDPVAMPAEGRGARSATSTNPFTWCSDCKRTDSETQLERAPGDIIGRLRCVDREACYVAERERFERIHHDDPYILLAGKRGTEIGRAFVRGEA
jgi:hypothetical protein